LGQFGIRATTPFAAAAVATLAPARRAVPADPLVALRDL
jgi:ABC-type lipoprotein release transport system permease subunit